jgi:ABC-2 type transport system ATP-binding protein
MMANVIETNGLAKGYGKTQALQPTTLQVPEGAVFALVGHNGAGKTTLIKMLMNILHPSEGTATVCGHESHTLTGDAFQSIGYVSENQELPEWMTVREYLDYLKPFYPVWETEALIQALDVPLDRRLKQLSRGMLMKAALASVLAFQPKLIVLDEPFSGLDPLVRDELIEALIDVVNGEEGRPPVTILISSHDLAEIESFATHIGYLNQGKLVFAEEMSSLNARFREVTVTLAGDGQGVPPPASWLLLERSASVAKFVHSQADTEPVAEQIAAVFPGAGEVTMESMTLRTIFLALARSGRAPIDMTAKEKTRRRA